VVPARSFSIMTGVQQSRTRRRRLQLTCIVQETREIARVLFKYSLEVDMIIEYSTGR
jgi:hypothetical protein